MHICGLLEVILQGSGSAPPVPPCTKAELAVLLLGCCPPTASSTSPDVLACLLVAPPCSGHYADRHKQTFLPQLALIKTTLTTYSSTPLRRRSWLSTLGGPDQDHDQVLLEGAEVEAVDSYRYLGLWLDNKLDWTTHTSHLYGKTQSRMYFLRRLMRSFNICSKLLQMFYQSVVASVLFYTVVCLGGSISKKDTSRLDKLIRRGRLCGRHEAGLSMMRPSSLWDVYCFISQKSQFVPPLISFSYLLSEEQEWSSVNDSMTKKSYSDSIGKMIGWY
ncbi:hypothetical protein L3Q82_001050 [Scortum barcoo]|uniref:Uncharacterized protein n=1 Tax=Scortum barcoo TaxID=214431 RepID=A0ACB8WB25_9TELE|nr:hypothetical protein L3Q82_001050 [Scortum barcoo]